ncbi:MAG: PASTA domain-containing protein [Candidatus Hydrogenedens sp.]|nr:PASTA domain-containing protein [Candidatus Hydrogenedens sp.]
MKKTCECCVVRREKDIFLYSVLFGLMLIFLVQSSSFSQTNISSIEDLQKIGTVYPLNGSYILTQDIDASDTINWNGGAGFVPIGTYATPFTGTFDGKNKKITNLWIKRGTENYVGLFGGVGATGNIVNLTIENEWVVGKDYVGGLVGSNFGTTSNCRITGLIASSGKYIGGLIGYNNGNAISCYVKGSVIGNSCVGGLIGYKSAGSISQCYTTGFVSGITDNAGGLLGEHWNGSIQNSYSWSSVKGYANIGGFIGKNTNGTVSYCYSKGFVSGISNVGGFIGSRTSGTITSCYWDTETSGQSASSGGSGRTTAQMKTQSNYISWNFTTTWAIIENQTYPYLRSFGQTQDYIPVEKQISNLNELNNIGRDLNYPWDGQYTLTTDIDASDTVSWDGGLGFKPIGIFTGRFDGNGHVIKNLYINRWSSKSVGFIGNLIRGEVLNLGLKNIQVTGNMYVGCLIGTNYGVVKQSYVTGSAIGATDYVGGLVGFNNYGKLENSYSWSSAQGNQYIGGLIGRNIGISGSSFGVVDKCYSKGAVTGNIDVGGLIGNNLNGTVTSSYWDTQTSGRNTSSGGTGRTTAQMKQQATFVGWDFVNIWGIVQNVTYPYLLWEYTVPDVLGLTQSEAQDLITYYGFTVGTIGNQCSNVVPIGNVLSQNPAGGLQRPPGTPVDIVVVSSLCVDVPDVVHMEQSSAENTIISAGLVVGTINTECNDTVPLGHVISQNPTAGEQVSPGSTVDLVVSTGPCPVEVPNVAGLSQLDAENIITTARLSVGEITEECNNAVPLGHVISQDPPAGQYIPPYSQVNMVISSGPCIIYISSIDDLQKIGNDPDYPIDGYYELTQDLDATDTINWNGGAGFVPIGTIDTPFTGSLNGNKHSIVGLYINRPSETYVGLLSCIGTEGIIQNLALKNATIIGGNFVGSIAGYNMSDAVISSCYASGTVSSLNYNTEGNAGGLIGHNAGTVQQCFSKVDVWSPDYSAGLIGFNSGYIIQCYSKGKVNSSNYSLGLVGRNFGLVTQSYWDINASGTNSSDGGIGETTTNMKKQITFVDWDFTNVWGIVEDVTYPYLLGFSYDPEIQLIGPQELEISCGSEHYAEQGAVAYDIEDGDLTNQIMIMGEVNTSALGVYLVDYLVSDSNDNLGKASRTINVIDEAPIVTLLGSPKILVRCGTEFIDPGAQAYDFCDQSYLTVEVTGSVDINEKGIYQLEYTARDSSNLESHVSRDVRVYGCNIIQIRSIEELQMIGNSPDYPLDGDYELVQDIDASGTAQWNEGAGFIPIGDQLHPFSGTFNGNEHKIVGLHINRPEEDYVGLFRSIGPDGILWNFGIEDANITGGNYVGIITGLNSGILTQCYVTGSVSGIIAVGGLISSNYGEIENCYSTATTSGIGYVAGLVFVNYNKMTNCYSSGAVLGEYETGGLTYDNLDGIVTNCYWDVQTSGQSWSDGGIGKSTEEMKQLITFDDWDFVNVWGIIENTTYPYFLWQYKVPDIIGLSQSEAETLIITKGFEVGEVNDECSNTIPAGYVSNQNPTAGEQIPPGSNVNLTIASGRCTPLVVILEAPTELIKTRGETLELHVSVQGEIGTVNYQWYFEPADEEKVAIPLLGENSDTLRITNIDYIHAGWYWCQVSDDWDFTESGTVRLYVDSGLDVSSMLGLFLTLIIVSVIAIYALKQRTSDVK